MKKNQSLGRSLSNAEMKQIAGGNENLPGGGGGVAGCSQAGDFCGTHDGNTYSCCPRENLTCQNYKCV